MPKANANGIEIGYETFGHPSDRPLLLIMGLGSQLIRWPSGLCERLAEFGHLVIRFDHRDSGLSTKFDELGIPDQAETVRRAFSGEPVEARYTLTDMAADCIGLLDALGIARAHICGLSMGGAIAQLIARVYPERTRSLISMMSTAEVFAEPRPDPAAVKTLGRPSPSTREAYIEHTVELDRVTVGTGFPFDEARSRRLATQAYERGHYPAGMARHAAAAAQLGKLEDARSITAPTLVLHGSADPIVPLEWGRRTASAIPGASLTIIEGMGHELPEGARPQVVEAIAEHTTAAEAAG